MSFNHLRLTYGLTSLVALGLASVVSGACSSDGPAASVEGSDASTDAAPSGNDHFAAESTAPAPEAPSCVAESGLDDPDDDFKDSNCDGIDGDKTKAIFVAPTGSDSAAGTIDAPVSTIGKALTMASAAKKDVFICNDTYAENVTITAGIRLFGGYDCKAGWKRTTDKPSIAPQSGKALVIRGLQDAVKIDRIGLVAQDATSPGESSIAAFIVASPSVSLSHVDFHAGAGADGKPGDAPASNTTPPAKSADGQSVAAATCDPNNLPYNPAVCATSGAGAQVLKVAGGSCQVGGAGGNGGNVAYNVATQPGSYGGHYNVIIGVQDDGAPGGSVGNAGVPGNPGTDGLGGLAAKTGIGTISSDGYVPSNVGSDGKAGDLGQAGGGGSGGDTRFVFSGGFPVYYLVGGGGGQGGFGGCGGLAGKGGGGGGASIGLLLINSPITITWSKFETSDGGRGGSPSSGAAGQPGGAAGTGGAGTGSGIATPSGYPGGPGARGGAGGAGGPGGGGPAVGLLSVGGAPTVTNETYHTGAGGLGGRGLTADNGTNGESHDRLDENVDGGVPLDAGSDARSDH
jgi:hypothetical protein